MRLDGHATHCVDRLGIGIAGGMVAPDRHRAIMTDVPNIDALDVADWDRAVFSQLRDMAEFMSSDEEVRDETFLFIGLLDVTCTTFPQLIFISPYSVSSVRMLSSIVTMSPVRRSPLRVITSSAHVETGHKTMIARINQARNRRSFSRGTLLDAAHMLCGHEGQTLSKPVPFTPLQFVGKSEAGSPADEEQSHENHEHNDDCQDNDRSMHQWRLSMPFLSEAIPDRNERG
jgi:hypothetical protein